MLYYSKEVKKMICFAGITLLCFGLDSISKAWVNKNMDVGESREIAKNRLYIWHIKNKGLPYNKFEGYMKWIIGSSCILIGVLVQYFIAVFQTRKDKRILWSGAIFFGGALGNLIERIRKREVTDFIYIKAKGLPVFNISDSCICFGGLLFFLSSLFIKEKNQKNQ